jgi:hypothetical protein
VACHQLLVKGFLTSAGIFDLSNGQVSKERGCHLVMSVKIPVPGFEAPVSIFLKFFPDLPLVDIAATELATLLVGPHLPWVELVKVRDLEKFYPVVICEGIPGEVIGANHSLIQKLGALDAVAYSKRVIVSLFLNQEDAKDTNFIVKDLFERASSSTPLYELVSVDNDRSFYPSLICDGISRSIPHVKDISLLFDEMHTVVAYPVRESFLMLDPNHILQQFLRVMENVLSRTKLVFNEDEKQHFFPTTNEKLSLIHCRCMVTKMLIIEESFLDFFLPENTMEVLFFKFWKIHHQLLNFPDTTHLNLLQLAEPYLSKRYKKLLAMDFIR